jgi:hypothetical protein
MERLAIGLIQVAATREQVTIFQPVGRIANPPFSVEKEAGYAFGYNPPYGLVPWMRRSTKDFNGGR